MRRRWRRWRANPASNTRLALIAIVASALAGVAGGGNSSLFNIIGALCIGMSAWFEGCYASIVGDFLPRSLRTGAILRFAGGLGLALLGWWVPDLRSENYATWWDAVSAGCLFGGVALMLSGVARLVATDFARYASRKLQDRLDDDF